MNPAAGSSHLSLETLLDWWLHDTDPACTDAVDEHLLRCDACGAALDELVALAAGVSEAFRAGEVSAVIGHEFLRRLSERGLRVREYRLPHDGGVDCTVAPDDDLLVARIEAPLAGVTRLDAVAEVSIEPGSFERLDDVPFDAAAGELLYAPKLTAIRAMPAHELRLTLLANGPGGERPIGRYTFRHTPWPGQV